MSRRLFLDLESFLSERCLFIIVLRIEMDKWDVSLKES